MRNRSIHTTPVLLSLACLAALAQCNGTSSTSIPPSADGEQEVEEVLSDVGEDLPPADLAPPDEGVPEEENPDDSPALDITDTILLDSDLIAETPADADLPHFRTCDGAPLPEDPETVDWNHWYNGVIALGDPDHSAQDVIAVVGRDSGIVGKFAYGTFSKDLQDEWVEVFIDDCSPRLVRLGQVLTDSDGRITLPLSSAQLPVVGAYAVHLRVMGDNTWAHSTLRVVPPATRLCIFDIDGTLTTDDVELFHDLWNDLFSPILTGDYIPQARAGAVDITLLRGPTQGYVLVYLTGRPYNLTGRSQQWLSDLGFPPGSLHMVDSVSDILPTEGQVGAYKTEYLASLTALGLELVMAYGNASTDIYAYGQAGIPTDRTYILGDHGGEGGTIALGEDYLEHLQDAALEPSAGQPFNW